MHTVYYKEFKKLLGSSVHNLNTICVGLEQIKENTTAPETLRISWHSQNKLDDAKRARRHAINLFLVATVDAIEYYINSLCKNSFILSSSTIEAIKCAKADSDKGIKDLVQILFDDMTYSKGIKAYWVPSIKLLISWRNVLVHVHKANANIVGLDKTILQSSKDDILQHHSGTDIERTIKNFEAKQPPTLKDYSTLLTILLRAFKEFDINISESITEENLKGLILDQLGLNVYNNLLKEYSETTDSLKKLCKSQNIIYSLTDVSNTTQHLKQTIIEHFSRREFNKLTCAETKRVKRLEHFCKTHSIPYNTILLDKIV